MDPATVAMFSTIFLALLGNFWQQSRNFLQLSRENSKTRDLINDSRIELRSEIKDLGDELRSDHKELRDELRGEIKVLGIGLGDVRERLAGIEGFLRIGMSPPAEPATSA